MNQASKRDPSLPFRWASIGCLGLALLANAPLEAQERILVRVPAVDVGVNLLETRSQSQMATRDLFKVRHDFSFTDQQPESGIDFEHESVDDSAITWKPVHYDHGNGVAVADIDDDGRFDLYFTSQLGGSQMWRNLGSGKFENVTATSGTGLADRIGVTASYGDIDNDGDADLFVTTVRTGNAMFENDGTGRFRDISSSAGIDYSGHSSGAVFFDFDNDGLLDLFVTNVGNYTYEERGRGGFYIGREDAFQGHLFPERFEHSILYRNLGDNRFQDVSKEMGLMDDSWAGDATLVDFNGDRFPDLYVLNMQGDDHYWENQAGTRFVEKTKAYFDKTSWGAMGVKFFDFNNNGRMDLLVTDMHSDMVPEGIEPLFEKNKPFGVMVEGGEDNIAGNAFYLQQEDGSFREVSDELGAENYWPWGISVEDLNADGYDDVFLASSMNYPYRYGINSVFLNNRGERFLDAEFILGVEPRRDGRHDKPVFDLDCGGKDREHEQCKGRNDSITIVGALGSRASVMYDLDDDGDLDIVTGEFNDVSQVLISDLADQGSISWVKIELSGKKSNRDGLGALTRVTTGDRTLTKYHDGKSGYLSQSSMPMYFGLGDGTKIESIEVVWPSGQKQTVTESLGVNRLIEIVEE